MTKHDAWNAIYRPKKIAELHLEKVKELLSRYLSAGKIPQSLLLTGPKGTGKTSASRIIGAILNDPKNETAVKNAYYTGGSLKQLSEPDSKNPIVQQILAGTSFVVVELDAASNRGIDDIRQLRERVQFPPQGALMSVYILDEVHMLTTEAFNALLKLLEEPPNHALFVLATTEFHKIPETIVSRCQVVEFSKATQKEIIASLTQVLLAEKIAFEEDALEAIAAAADGSFRDAVKLLESFKQEPKVTKELVLNRLGLVSAETTALLLAAILEKDTLAITKTFTTLRSSGVSAKQLQSSLLTTLHQALLTNLEQQTTAGMSAKAAHFLLTHLSDHSLIQPSPIPLLHLELKILELVLRAKKQSGGGTTAKLIKKNPPPQPETASQPKKNTAAAQGDGELLVSQWSELVATVAEKNKTVAALLQSAKPMRGGPGLVQLQVYYKFHQEQLSQPKFHSITQDSIKEIIGAPISFEYILDQEQLKREDPQLAVEALL